MFTVSANKIRSRYAVWPRLVIVVLYIEKIKIKIKHFQKAIKLTMKIKKFGRKNSFKLENHQQNKNTIS